MTVIEATPARAESRNPFTRVPALSPNEVELRLDNVRTAPVDPTDWRVLAKMAESGQIELATSAN